MGMVVNSNISSLVAQSAANATNKLQETSMERLSTGKRINSASDDAAGIAIASRLEANINGLNQAIRNAADAQSLIDTAEGAMDEQTNILQRVRELSVQSANDTNSAADRKAMQDEVTQLIAELDRISSTTSWAGDKLLDGSFTSKNFQIGTLAAEKIDVSIKDQSSGALGVFRFDSTAQVNPGTASASLVVADEFDIVGKDGAVELVSSDATPSVKDMAALANAQTSNTGVTVQAVTKARIAIDAVPASTVTFNINGGGTSSAISVAVASNTNLTTLKDAINAVSGTTQVTAVFDGSDKSKLILIEADGDDITLEDFSDTGTATNLVVEAGNFAGDTFTDSTNVVSAASGANDAVITGVMRFESTEAFSIANQEGGDSSISNTTGFFGSAASGAGSLTAMSAVDVSTLAGAQSAISVIDGALARVAETRGDLGAKSNRLDFTMSNLSNIVVNSSASKSRIEDADFAVETSNLTKSQILQQAATSMLAQANASKQSVLSLLQG